MRDRARTPISNVISDPGQKRRQTIDGITPDTGR